MKKSLQVFFAVMCICAILCGELSPILAQSQSVGNGEIQKVTAQWSSLAPMPGEKMYHSSAYYKGAVYVFGGTGKSGASNDIYKYDVAKNTWSNVGTLPEVRNYSTADVVGDTIYVIGGYSNIANPFTLATQVLAFDPATNGYYFKSDIPNPIAGHASVVIGNKIYLMGGAGKNGWATDYQSSVQIYDPATDTWAVADSMPVALRNMAAGAVGNTIITVGGYNSKLTPTSKPDVFRGEVSGTTITWTKKSDYPAGALSKVSGGSSDTKVYFTGGQQPSVIVPNTYAYNLATNAWEALQDKPSPIHSGSKMVYDGSFLYCPGGQITSGASTVFEAITTVIVPRLQMTIPNLDKILQVGTTRKYSIAFSNIGTGTLTWNASIEPTGTTWIALTPSSGSVDMEQSQAFTLTMNATGKTVGDYTATLKITTNDPAPSRSTITIPITMHVQNDPADVPRKMLLEEVTGTWCQFCPYGADSVKAIVDRYPDEVIAVAYHNADPMTAPLEPAMELFLKAPYYPSGFINRIAFPGDVNVEYGRGVWGFHIDSLLGINSYSTVQISLANKSYDRNSKQMSLTVNVRFLQAANGPVRVNIVQSESGFNWWQQKGANIIFPYIHNHVVRLIVPNVPGEIITTNPTITAGYTFTKDFTFKSNDSVAANCKLVVIVHQSNGTTAGEVLQTFEEPVLLNATSVTNSSSPTEFSLSQNYPNPFNPSTMINYTIPKNSFVTVKVYNILGKQIATLVSETKDSGTYSVSWDAKGISSGMYYYKLESGNTSITKKMTLLK